MAKDYGLSQDGSTKADIQRGDLVRFFPEDLLPNTENYRFGATDTDEAVTAERNQEIEDMVSSLCEEGQKQPIVIRPVSGDRFQVHIGDTRHRASLRINERKIWPWSKDGSGLMRIECKVEKLGAKEAFNSSIVENLHRNGLTVIDQANGVRLASEKFHFTDAEIMKAFQQKDPAWLPNMRRLARLPIDKQRAIHLHQISASIGYVLAEIPEQFHDAILEEAAQPVVVETTTFVEEAQASAEQEQEPTRRVRKPSKADKPVKVTARRVTEVARSKGLLKHKKVSITVAQQREFWGPLAGKKDSLLGKLAEASMEWLNSADDDAYYKAVLGVLKKA